MEAAGEVHPTQEGFALESRGLWLHILLLLAIGEMPDGKRVILILRDLRRNIGRFVLFLLEHRLLLMYPFIF